jgi:NAD(P)-dependent dehydrogenase (short-subunit alcohol dehydrogenase family)
MVSSSLPYDFAPDLAPQRPICLITGATDGVGAATALALAMRGFRVVIVARNPVKAVKVRAELEAASGAHIDVIAGDLSRLSDVVDIAGAFKARYPRLDVLINNAGVMLARRQVTEDGLEATWQVNYLSAFLLTQLLLGELEKSEQGRIINLSSSVYTSGKLGPDDERRETRYSAIDAYAASKLAMLLFSLELARRLEGTSITVNAVHPGVVRTQMLAAAEGVFKLIALLATPFALSPYKGAETSIHLASAPELATTSGCYFVKARPRPVKSRFNTVEAREALWRSSVETLQALGMSHG